MEEVSSQPNLQVPAQDSSLASSSNAQHAPTALRRDNLFYFRLVFFQVGETLFSVPRNGFEVPGTIFEAMFALPTDDEQLDIEGCSDEKPIVLEGIQEDHFRGFLAALHPTCGQFMTHSDWIGALHLSTMWDFQKIRASAIASLAPLIAEQSSQETVLLAKRYRVVDWLRNAYKQLVEKASLTISDLRSPQALDWETIAKIFSARAIEALTPATNNGIYRYCPKCSYYPFVKVCACGYRESNADKTIDEMFREELDQLEGDSSSANPPLPVPVVSTETPLTSAATSPAKAKKRKRK